MFCIPSSSETKWPRTTSSPAPPWASARSLAGGCWRAGAGWCWQTRMSRRGRWLLMSRGQAGIPFKIFSQGDDQGVHGEVWGEDVSLLWTWCNWQVIGVVVNDIIIQCSEWLDEFRILMFRGSWRQMWDKAAEFLDNKIDVLVNNAGVSPKLGYDICMKVLSTSVNKIMDPILTDKPWGSHEWCSAIWREAQQNKWR